ncbi:uncharacterized protein BDV17DRAFT_291029 [Aspergillus undulatus]|uniref:uncharacterized protein n=1 Tax=Aspergillus undulatus TaxID=1810928 RepID=UPI003CCDABEF
MARIGRSGFKRGNDEKTTTQNTPRKKSETKTQLRTRHDDTKSGTKSETNNPFLLIPESIFPIQSALAVIKKSGIDITPPREMPQLPKHGPRKAKIGTVLKPNARNRTEDPAYARVSAYGHYTIVDPEDKLLEPGQYRMGPACNTEEKLLRAVLMVVEGFAKSLSGDKVDFRAELDSYCSERRSWEVGLIKQLEAKGLITISAEDLLQLETWCDSFDEASFHEENFQWYRKTIAPSNDHSGVPSHEWISFDLIEHVHNAVRSLTRDIQRLQVPNEPEQLLIKFDDEGKDIAREKVQPHYIPPSGRDASEKFYHWCLERHGRWARDKFFHSFSGHEVHQLANLEDLPFMDHNDIPRGHHGLIWQLVGHTEPELEKYPWGLPAHKLYETMRSSNIDGQYYSIPARDLLIDLEQWYHNKPNKIKKALQETELMEWPLKDKKIVEKRAKLLELANYASIE